MFNPVEAEGQHSEKMHFVEFKAQTFVSDLLFCCYWHELALFSYFIRLLEFFECKETASTSIQRWTQRNICVLTFSRLFEWLTPDNLLWQIYRHTCLTLIHIHVNKTALRVVPRLILNLSHILHHPHILLCLPAVSVDPTPPPPNTQSYAFYKATV